MIRIDDIHTLTEFQRNTKEYLKHLKETGRPLVLTVNGRPELVVQHAKAYQETLETCEALQAPHGLKSLRPSPEKSVPGLI